MSGYVSPQVRERLDGDCLLTLGEVAAMFGVNRKTVTRWASDGRMPRLRTPGGHSRFYESDMRELLKEQQT